jgi:hypothetical protein
VTRARNRSASHAETCLLAGFSLLYVVTRFPGVGGVVNHGDSAKFQFLGRVLGVSHPPGNPLYLLLNAAWVRLPLPCRLSTKVTLLSGLFAVLTLRYVYRSLDRLWGGGAAAAGALALGLGPLFWTFATEAEVYSLNTFLLAAACDSAAAFAVSGRERPMLKGALFLSLGFANHLTSAMILPAALVLVALRVARGSRLRPRDVGITLGFALLAASLYLYIPLRVRAEAVYSEFAGPLTWRSLWDYVTAKKYQENIAAYSNLRHAIHDRAPTVLAFLQKQWPWPLLSVIPIGAIALGRRAPIFAVFVFTALLGLFAFALVYDIDDLDGFFMPIVTLLSFGVGGTVATLGRRWLPLVWLGLGAALAPLAVIHVKAWSRAIGFEVAETLEGTTVPSLWNLDELVAKVPIGSRLAAPCSHYGCVQVLHYYRLGDPVFEAKGLGLVRFSSLDTGHWTAVIPVVEPGRARNETICAIRQEDADAMRSAGAFVSEQPMPSKRAGGVDLPGLVLYCSHPRG